jgi:hypothetical protein
MSHEGIEFLSCRFALQAEEVLEVIWSPSRVLRWCCSVHKSARNPELRARSLQNDDVGHGYVGFALMKV